MITARFKNRWFNQSSAVIFGVVSFFVLAIAWSFWAELDQVSRAPGQVIPTGRIQVIQSTDLGEQRCLALIQRCARDIGFCVQPL